jgi:hypothetical protein
MTEGFAMGLARLMFPNSGQGAQADPVEETGRALAAAQERLAQAETARAAAPYLPSSQPTMKKWHAAVDEVARAKQVVRDAQVAHLAAQNIRAGKAYTDRLNEERRALQQQRDTQAAHRAMIEEETSREQFEAAWLASGGTAESFAKQWKDTLWPEELARRTRARLENQDKARREHGRYSF